VIEEFLTAGPQPDHLVCFALEGGEPVLVRVPNRCDLAALLNRCRARVFPDVAMVPAGHEKPVAKSRRRR
jgi:hypothetical protein